MEAKINQLETSVFPFPDTNSREGEGAAELDLLANKVRDEHLHHGPTACAMTPSPEGRVACG